MAKTLFFGIFIYKQEFGTVEPEMLKEASKRMPTGKIRTFTKYLQILVLTFPDLCSIV